MNRIINPGGAAAPLSKFAPGIETTADSRMLHVSGQVGIDADGKIGADAETQIRLAFANVQAVLEAADMGWADVVRLNTYLTDAGDVGTFRKVRDEVLDGAMTASTLLVISALVHPDMVVEIECVAARA